MKNKLIIIIVAVVVVVAAALVYFVVLQDNEEPVIREIYSPGDYFVTNVKGGNRLFKVVVVLELNTDKLQDYLSDNNHVIRDTIIFLLRDLDADTIDDRDSHVQLRQDMVGALNERLELGMEEGKEGKNCITNVYFTDYVMQ